MSSRLTKAMEEALHKLNAFLVPAADYDSGIDTRSNLSTQCQLAKRSDEKQDTVTKEAAGQNTETRAVSLTDVERQLSLITPANDANTQGDYDQQQQQQQQFILHPDLGHSQGAPTEAEPKTGKPEITLRLNPEILSELTDEEVFELLARELHGCGNLLRGIREQYDHFLAQGQLDDELTFILPTKSTNDASRILQKTEEDPRTEVQSTPEKKKTLEARNLSSPHDHHQPSLPRQHDRLRSKDSPNLRSRRLVGRKLISTTQSIQEYTSYIQGVSIDWERVKQCSTSLKGVVEVIPMYSKTFESVAERLSPSKPMLATALLHVWKAHLELLMVIVAKCRADMRPDDEINQLLKNIRRLTTRYESNRQLLAKASQEIEALCKQQRDIQRRLSTKEEALVVLLEQERRLLGIEQDLEHVVTVARQELEHEQSLSESAQAKAQGNEEGVETGDQENGEDDATGRGKKHTLSRSSFGMRSSSSQASNTDEGYKMKSKSGINTRRSNASSLASITSEEGGICVAEILGPGIPAQSGRASPGSASSSSSSTSDESDGFGEDLDAAEERAIEQELSRLNQEIAHVEREAERQREARAKEREVRRRKQMIKVKDLDSLIELYADIERLTLRFERAYVENSLVGKHEFVAHHTSWEMSLESGDDPAKGKRLKSPGPQKTKHSSSVSPTKGASSRKPHIGGKSSPAKRGGRGKRLAGGGKPSDQGGQPRATKKGNGSLTRFDIPSSVWTFLRSPVDDSLFERGGGRALWSLRNLYEVIFRTHLWVLKLRKRPNYTPGVLARDMSDLFHEEYGHSDLADCALVNFHLTLLRYKSTKVGPKVFRTLCEAPSDFVDKFYTFLDPLGPYLQQGGVDYTVWVDLELAQVSAESALRNSLAERRKHALALQQERASGRLHTTLYKADEAGSAEHDGDESDRNDDDLDDEEEEDDILRVNSNDEWQMLKLTLDEFGCYMEGRPNPMINIDDISMLLIQAGCFGSLQHSKSEATNE